MDVATSTEHRRVGIRPVCSSLPVRPAFPTTCLTNLLPHTHLIHRKTEHAVLTGVNQIALIGV